MNFLTTSLVFAVIGLSASTVLGCSCLPKPTVLDAFESSELVVEARMLSVDKPSVEEGAGYYVNKIRSVTMVVSKVFKGKVKPGQELKFAQGGGADCVWTFSEDSIGNEYLLYLGPPGKGLPFSPIDNGVSAEPVYYAGHCGRSTSLDGARDDLSYLENIEKYRGKTRLSGRFGGGWWLRNGSTGADIKLKIIGKTKSYEAKTDKEGFFEIYGLLPGEYLVSVLAPFGWKVSTSQETSTGYDRFDPRGMMRAKNQIPILIRKGRHAALDVTFDVDTAIKGTVLSPSGKPMDGVSVMAVSTELKEGDYSGRFVSTDENGEFVIEEVAPGNYILVVNPNGRKDETQPFGVVFYPGVTDFGNAAVIAVQAGKYVTGRTIQIPQTVALVPIKGQFVFSDGRPVISEWVTFIPDDKTKFNKMSQETDVDGTFLFHLPKGVAGTINGELWSTSGQFKNCPKLEAMIKESGNASLTVAAPSLHVDSLEPPEAVEIVLPFPYCEKVKKD